MKNTDNMIKVMTQSLFQRVPLRRQSLFQRLFRQYAEENAVIEVNNLLADRSVTDIKRSDLIDIEHRYNVSLGEFSLNLQEFYAVLLHHFAQQYAVSPDSRTMLEHLETLFTLDRTTVHQLHIIVGEPIYRQIFRKSISGGRLEEAGRGLLGRFASNMRLPTANTDIIRKQESETVISKFITHIIAKNQFSPAEEQELNNVCQNLDMQLSLPEETTSTLRRLKQYWKLKKLPLPVEVVNIQLQNNEECHISIPHVSWCETRAVRTGGGQSEQRMKILDHGTLYLTNKRILFAGHDKKQNIQLNRVLKYRELRDGVSIEKDAGKSPFLKFSGSTDMFSIILRRVLEKK